MEIIIKFNKETGRLSISKNEELSLFETIGIMELAKKALFDTGVEPKDIGNNEVIGDTISKDRENVLQ